MGCSETKTMNDEKALREEKRSVSLFKDDESGIPEKIPDKKRAYQNEEEPNFEGEEEEIIDIKNIKDINKK